MAGDGTIASLNSEIDELRRGLAEEESAYDNCCERVRSLAKEVADLTHLMTEAEIELRRLKLKHTGVVELIRAYAWRRFTSGREDSLTRWDDDVLETIRAVARELES